jgi:photosystem II stability/assembly factor-like uncharacterized protein
MPGRPAILVACVASACGILTGCSGRVAPESVSPIIAPTLTPQQSGTTSRLQAVSPVNERVVWASGAGGTFVVTTDGGSSWRAGVVPGTDSLEFRDVQGVSDRVAYLMSAGNGAASRIYRTDDGGTTWTRQFLNPDPDAFYDCFAFWDGKRGIAMSDAVKGVFPALRTPDGTNWENIGTRLPAAQQGEGAFAASGTCVATQGDRLGWIATGAAARSRVLRTTDGGDSWAAFPHPLIQGTATSGAFTIAFRDSRHGFLGGGEIAADTAFSDNVAVSSDGGQTWTLRTRSPFSGAIYGSSYIPGSGPAVVITGPKGAAWSSDEGTTWSLLEGVRDYWAVAFANAGAGWLVGTQGRILKVSFPAP